MKVPEGVARHFELGEDAWREWRGFGGGVYPPPGFLPLPLLDNSSAPTSPVPG